MQHCIPTRDDLDSKWHPTCRKTQKLPCRDKLKFWVSSSFSGATSSCPSLTSGLVCDSFSKAKEYAEHGNSKEESSMYDCIPRFINIMQHNCPNAVISPTAASGYWRKGSVEISVLSFGWISFFFSASYVSPPGKGWEVKGKVSNVTVPFDDAPPPLSLSLFGRPLLPWIKVLGDQSPAKI